MKRIGLGILAAAATIVVSASTLPATAATATGGDTVVAALEANGLLSADSYASL